MNTTIDDADSRIVYSTNPQWRTDLWLEQSPPAYLSTTHRTQNPGAIATFTFTGTAVYVYGHKASDHGYRDFSIDSAAAIRCDGRTGSQGSRVVLYWQDGLLAGTHELTIQHTGEALQWLNVDYFVVIIADPRTTSQTTRVSSTSTEGPTGSIVRPTPSSTPSSPTSNSSQSSSNTIIIGVVIAAAAIAVIALVIWYFCTRHPRKVKQQAEEHKDAAAAAAAWSPTGAIHAGFNPGPHIVEPFNHYNLSAGLPNPNAAPMVNAQHRGPYDSSWYYSQGGPQSTYSPAPSTYSPPPNQTQFQSLPEPVTNPVSNALAMPSDSHPIPWTYATSTHTGSDSNRTRIETSDQIKARYSGASDSRARYLATNSTIPGSSSSSRPLSPATINESVPPPPHYED